jgi:serine/threonine protein kinase
MGDVYKAKDVRLDRMVAVKILPERFAESAESRERFHREARVISQLNHPRICTLYDVGSENDVHYLVLEYIEGETLAERLKRGSLPLDTVLEYGIQIADGLERAHRSGIVHRDLKPGNVMLTKSGVKLLDFGLAKLLAGPSADDASDALTAEKSLTKEQAIVGTLSYMAPEQIEGRAVDARTDLWALGAVLYEMITGTRAAAVVRGDNEQRRAIEPPLLNEVIRRCLVVDPDGRWASASDIRLVLSWIAAEQPKAAPSGPRPIGLAIAALPPGFLRDGWQASPFVRDPRRKPNDLAWSSRFPFWQRTTSHAPPTSPSPPTVGFSSTPRPAKAFHSSFVDLWTTPRSSPFPVPRMRPHLFSHPMENGWRSFR